MDLVSREEFEVQKAVLAKTRQKLEAMEQRIADIEQQVLTQEGERVTKAKGTKHKTKAE